MNCVQQCDTNSTIAINDTQFDNRLFCRGFNYYVDPESESVIELGTKEHPYKDIGYAFIELLNYHSHTDRNITVSVKENTSNYMRLSNNIVVNTTNVEIIPYTDVLNKDPEKALLIGSEFYSLSPIIGTSFNIMKTFESRFDQAVTDNDEITDTEKSYFEGYKSVITVVRSNFRIDNMEFETEFSSIYYEYMFLLFVWIQEKQITMTNQHWRTSGGIFLTFDPLKMYMENIDVDYYKNIWGMAAEVYCDYPEAALDSTFFTKNVSFYYSQERAVVPTSDGAFYYSGPGDYIIEDFSSKIWSYSNEPYGQIGVNINQYCNPENDKTKYFNYTNLYFELLEQDGNAVNLIAGRLTESPYSESKIFLTNVTRNNCF